MIQDITQISDEMLRELWLSEQLSFVEYDDELKRRFAMMSGKSEPQSIGALAEKVVASLDERNEPYDPEIPITRSLLLAAVNELREWKVNKGGDDQVMLNIAAAVRHYDPR